MILQEDRQMLIDIYHQEDQFSESANAYIEDSLKEKSLESRIRCLSRAKESLDKALLIPGAGSNDFTVIPLIRCGVKKIIIFGHPHY